jgi:hypothetical protein
MRYANLSWVAALAMCIAMGTQAAEMGSPDMEKFQPGKEHDAMSKASGKYDVAAKCWMEEGKPAVESKGTAEFTMVLGGRYLRQDFKGEMMGKPFTGLGYCGFDRAAGKYVSVWMDDYATGMLPMTGTSSDGGKTITYMGEGVCPKDGVKVKLRAVHTQIDNNKSTFDMFETRDDKERKMMELTYTRKS